MHGFLICIRIACVLAERSRSAPQALGTRSRWPMPIFERPLLEPPHSRRASARVPAPAPSPRRCVFIYFRRSQPARMVALVSSQ
eukprot:6188761-Pleurochrysis_carterae.AAC.1